MGRQLMLDYPSFLEDIRSMDKVLKQLENEAPSWTIEGQYYMYLLDGSRLSASSVPR